MAPAAQRSESPPSLVAIANVSITGSGGTRNRRAVGATHTPPPPPPSSSPPRRGAGASTAAKLLGLVLLADSTGIVRAAEAVGTKEVHRRWQRGEQQRHGPNSTHTSLHHAGEPRSRSYILNNSAGGTPPRQQDSRRVSLFAPRSSPLSAAPVVTKMTNDGVGGGGMWSVLRDFRGGHGAHRHAHPVDVAADAAAEVLSSGTAADTCTTMPLNIPLIGWKAIFQFLLTALNVLCWYVPLKHKTLRENKLGLSLANAFSGGVFLSLAFGHLIPECVHGFPDGTNEALPYMIMLGGYLLIFFVEKVAFDAHGMLEGHTHGHDHDQGHVHGHGHDSANGSSTNGKGVAKTSTASPTKQGQSSSSSPPSTLTRQDSGSGGASSGRSAVILLGALAVHSILEMASLGLSSNFADCALLSLSIGLHQPAESIALLVAFLKSGLTERQIVQYLSAFSAMGPIGTGLGVAVQQFASPLVDSVMLAVVAGTFIYVGATEVIPEEWEEQEHKWKKFAALLGGIVSIYVITQYTAGLEA